MTFRKLLVSVFAASLFLAGAALAGDDKAATASSKPAKCCAKAEKDGKACEHSCCTEAAAAGKNCEKCGGSGAVAKK